MAVSTCVRDGTGDVGGDDDVFVEGLHDGEDGVYCRDDHVRHQESSGAEEGPESASSRDTIGSMFALEPAVRKKCRAEDQCEDIAEQYTCRLCM